MSSSKHNVDRFLSVVNDWLSLLDVHPRDIFSGRPDMKREGLWRIVNPMDFVAFSVDNEVYKKSEGLNRLEV